MYKIILITFLQFAFSIVYGQGKSTSIALSPYNGDTSKYYRNAINLVKTLKLNDLRISTYKFHFRVWTENQIIEIFYNDTNNIKGILTQYTVSLPKKNKKTKHFSKKTFLDKQIMERILSLTDTFDILKLPSDEKIDCWFTMGEYRLSVCKDGPTYFIETSNLKQYSFKNYNCPDTRSCALEKQFSYFISAINKCTDSDNSYLKFIYSLPKGCYYNGGISKCCNYKIVDNK
jgi:hypothetical protein